MELPAYWYDWPVKAADHNQAAGVANSGQASNLGTGKSTTASDGETEYVYTTGTQTHVVWNSITGLAYKFGQARNQFPGVGVMAFATGNTDPAGVAQIIQALGH